MPQLKPHTAKWKQKTPKYTYRSLKAHMVISVLTSTSFPSFTVFLFILGVLIFANVSKYYTFLISSLPFSSVQFSRSVMSDSLRPHESQDARPPCPSSSPGVHSNSSPLSRWCHPAISSSVIPFSSCPQSLPASESFPMSQLFARGSQSTGVSALASVLPMNTQDWSPLECTGWISFSWEKTLKSLLQHHSSKASILQCLAFFTVQLLYPYMTTGKT